VGQAVTFRARVGGYTDYSWDFGDGSSGSGRSVTHKYSTPGSYDTGLTVTDRYDQIDVSDKLVKVTVLTGDQLPTISGPSPKSRKDPFYSQVASSIARGARSVFCWNNADWNALAPGTKTTIILGEVEVNSPKQINLSPVVCRWLDLLHYRHARPAPTLNMALALVTFGHELTHTIFRAHHVEYTGQEEALANCVGMQWSPGVSVKLGTSLAYGRALASIVWRYWKPNHFPPGYWSSKCRPGGPWDLDPKNPEWP
jgi:PKD repeat protein